MRIDSSHNIAKINQELATKVDATNKELKNLRVLTKQVHEIVKTTNATQVMSEKAGPLPVSGQFTTSGGTVLMIVSGSVFFGSSGFLIGLNISVDGTQRGSCFIYNNQVNVHMATVPNYLVLSLPAGSHTVTLSAYGGTNSDGNDHYSVAVIEFPA